MYSAARGAQASTTHGAFGTGFGGVAANDQILANVSGISKSIVDALDSTAKSFGKTVGYEAAAGFASDFGDDATWGGLRIALNGANIVNWDDTRTSKWAPKEFAIGDEGYKQYLNAVALDVKSALLGMDLPTWADQLVSAATDLNTINAALQQIGGTKALFDSWGQSMSMFKDITGELQTQLLNGFGGPDGLSAGVGAFYEGFYTEQERMTILAGNLRDSLAGLELSIDPAMGEAAKAQFKSAVEAAMAAGQGELAAKLLAMSQSFVTAADALGKTMSDLLSERRTLSTEYLRASGDAQAYQAALRDIATSGYSDAERAAWDYNEALRSQIAAFDEAAQLQQSLAEITGKSARSVQGCWRTCWAACRPHPRFAPAWARASRALAWAPWTCRARQPICAERKVDCGASSTVRLIRCPWPSSCSRPFWTVSALSLSCASSWTARRWAPCSSS